MDSDGEDGDDLIGVLNDRPSISVSAGGGNSHSHAPPSSYGAASYFKASSNQPSHSGSTGSGGGGGGGGGRSYVPATSYNDDSDNEADAIAATISAGSGVGGSGSGSVRHRPPPLQTPHTSTISGGGGVHSGLYGVRPPTGKGSAVPAIPIPAMGGGGGYSDFKHSGGGGRGGGYSDVSGPYGGGSGGGGYGGMPSGSLHAMGSGSGANTGRSVIGSGGDLMGGGGGGGVSGAASAAADDEFKDREEKLFMAKIDRKCANLQKKGLYYQAVELMEQGLISRKQLYGPDSIQVVEASEKLVRTPTR